ncbi:hypothetical protein [Dyadobacter bucti]|uniref:hypothetical protein n=1 Tax=Dyadobacter bucti TaxID=2572203 RepID=UPI003F71F37E
MTARIQDIIVYYKKVVLEGDCNKLIEVAKNSILAEQRAEMTKKMSTPSISEPVTTTVNPWHGRYDFDSDTARCAVQMATTLFSIINFFGSVLGARSDKFPAVLRSFLSYTGTVLDNTEIDLLASVYRNSCMHGFFPRGSNVAITFNPNDPATECLTSEGNYVILNVMALHRIVSSGFYKLLHTSVEHTGQMQNNFEIWLNNEEGQKIEEQIRSYKKYQIQKKSRGLI